MLTCAKMDNNNLSPNLLGISSGGTGNNNNSSENIYIDIPTPSTTRSVSPLSSASPGKDKTFGFFQTIYRKISLKSSDELTSASSGGERMDSRSSSVDSCSSLSDRLQIAPKRRSSPCVKSSAEQILSLELSSASSDDSSRGDVKSQRESRRSSVRKLLDNLSITTPAATGGSSGTNRSRSLSCSSTSVNLLNHKILKQKAESKMSLFSTNSASATATAGSGSSTKPPPKKILRRPVSYTYLRGISGLPTQRVPRTSTSCSYYGR
ncbi:uncharacterized protein LOC120424832 [Culex pipiens pallens]|uniref:uncharacterized protein LOC120424832 n=1 Tax=Culex pipiens pallens TaxID=42434 RepID=UPI00195473A8|nr:uncharacterized protein LOC120424832 [Culex pipiens pallens]